MTLGDWGGNLSTILSCSGNPPATFIVFVLYNVIVILVTMNIFLSIVLDAYSSVKQLQESEQRRPGNEFVANVTVNEILARVRAHRVGKL